MKFLINNKIKKLLDLVGGVYRFRELIIILVINCIKNKNINNINIKRININFMWLVVVFKIKNESRQIKKERRCLNKNNSTSSSYFLRGQDNMNVLLCSINTLKRLYDISAVEVGQHFYWQIGSFQVHAQVLITSWVVIVFLLVLVILIIWNL